MINPLKNQANGTGVIADLLPNGTNGELLYNGKRISFTIELPWLNNKPQISCIS